MSKTTGKSLELATDRFLARDRLPIFLGQDSPQTIAMKEIIDNEIDIVSERGQKANKAIIYISPNRLKVMDNGTGISPDDTIGDSDKPSLYHACATMFSSSNYSENSQDTIGANGVGMTLANYTSKQFTILNFNNKNVKGYSFTDGFLNGVGNPDNPTDPEATVAASLDNGDYVENPLSFEKATETFHPMFERGFFIDVTWHKTPNNLFKDPADIHWLLNYAKIRTGEMKSGEIEIKLFEDDDFNKELKHFVWSKNNINDENYIKSWDEMTKENGSVLVKDGPWTFAFNTNPMNVDSICQSAPIKSRYSTNINITIQDKNIGVEVPFSMKYLSNDYPSYTDQTKVAVRFPYTAVYRAFDKSGEIYKYFYHQAEKAYMAQVIKDSDSSMFWPCLGDSSEGELIIAEGYSAISGLKSQRDPMTQACIALRGKILNTWNLDMVKAMRSDIVKQMLNAVLYNNYKRVIIAVDADDDGNHICSLLIALFHRFTNIIQEGKLYYVHTPHYLFKKRGKKTEWSDNAANCPVGYHVTTLKGLGGMSADEVQVFIMNHDTRDLVQIKDDPEAWNMLDEAFSYGGEHWIEKD